MNVSPAIPGPWVDTNWRITPSVAAVLRQVGKVGVMRYVPLPGNDSVSDISGVEIGCLLDAGLQVLLVQHVRRPPWLPAQHSGTIDAGSACRAAELAGYPAGAHLFLDFEGVAGTVGAAFAYCCDWGKETRAQGYLAGLYVGYSAILSPQELYDLPDFTSYWSDAGPRQVAVRGFAIKQHQPEVTIAGVQFDPDVVDPDVLGELPMVCSG